MTAERKALTSFLLALCLLSQPGQAATNAPAKPKPAEKATESPAKGKDEAPAKPAAPEKEKEKPAPSKPAAPEKEKSAPADNGKMQDGTKPAEKPDATEKEPEEPSAESEDEAAAEREEANGGTAVARPVTSDPVQVYGWREWVHIGNLEMKLAAKLDTGALTSSIHAEEKELFERDGKKWVRFIVTDPGEKNSPRTRIEAPLVRIAHIKEPGGKSEAREVVRLNFTIGERKLRADFTLNNRSNMLSPVLIGRTTIKEIGWVDPGRAYLADQKIMR
ncbi:RimK/LysX family protein [Luteolibacter sp. GHJ8]|uniref:RimK/LysX family protein n=1 Tax=Luteolibacter rhizosphaerae TaxID=2989719 RepID=A0ABT3G2X3_9BACT|nr:RimK/LysX family protein [Luteolibacter rhizosphaerae]MCW1914197.1 RimK/LysX family protein [Luteolibacter rhizosphaerae]